MTKVLQATIASKADSTMQDAYQQIINAERNTLIITDMLHTAGEGEERLEKSNAALFAKAVVDNGMFIQEPDEKVYVELNSLGVALGKVFKHNVGEITDGSHTINELYDHRCTLFLCLMSIIAPHIDDNPYGVKSVWHSRLHDDGTGFDDYTVVGIETEYGQTTYHVPDLPFGNYLRKAFPLLELDRAPKWDGHTSNDVLLRLSTTFLGQSLWATEKKEA